MIQEICLLQVSYSLTQLAKTQLSKDRKEIAPHDIPRMFRQSESLMELVGFIVLLFNSCLINIQEDLKLLPLYSSYVLVVCSGADMMHH